MARAGRQALAPAHPPRMQGGGAGRSIIIIIMILNTPLKVQYVYVWGFGERMIKSYAVAIL